METKKNEEIFKKKLILLYDIKSCPKELNLENINNIIENCGIVIWDSTNNGKEPITIDESLHKMDIKFYTIEDIVEKFGNI